jgi:hypothetical protein
MAKGVQDPTSLWPSGTLNLRKPRLAKPFAKQPKARMPKEIQPLKAKQSMFPVQAPKLTPQSAQRIRNRASKLAGGL